jgi:D-alanyl-D-alanine carboxypeptidase/D-alanyl-D-alanine-endopeptidase (penicillin-binding protein 4)
MRQVAFLVILALIGQACSLQYRIQNELKKAETDLHHHVGFFLWDDQKNKAVAHFQEDRYFTPASNTKILTLFAAKKILGDSLAALRYVQRNDSTVVWGMGDPSFLYTPVHQNASVFKWLLAAPGKLVFSDANFYSGRFGAGWAWSDYAYDYSPEKTPLPVYGNLVTVQVDEKIQVVPKVVHAKAPGLTEPITRQEHSNEIIIRGDSTSRGRWSIPFRYSSAFLASMLSDTLHRPVYAASLPLSRDARMIKSVPADSVYKVLMQASDNMIAEQLLLMCGQVLSDSLNTERAIEYIQRTEFADLPDPVRWVDGSGLSRYNQFTPRSIVHIWRKLDATTPRQELLPLLAIGGRAGTIRNFYKNTEPYIYGKTGSLSNNHCLSGFLFTRKGKVLFFSYMNSGFVAPTAQVRERMEKVLKLVHEKY